MGGAAIRGAPGAESTGAAIGGRADPGDGSGITGGILASFNEGAERGGLDIGAGMGVDIGAGGDIGADIVWL